MRFPEKPYKRNEIYIVRIKSLDQIKALGAQVRNDSSKNRRLSLVHSNGVGGGLGLTYRFIDEYFGTQKDIEVSFIRKTAGDADIARNIFVKVSPTGRVPVNGISLYDEWFVAPGEIFLPPELFEL